jgi:hypothetical protein
MDANAALLTLLAELRATIAEREDQIAQLQQALARKDDDAPSPG